MQLIDYLRVLRRRWLTISIVTLAAVGAAAFATLQMTPVYDASGQYIITPGTTQSNDPVSTSNLRAASIQAAVTFASLGSVPPVVSAARTAAGYPDAGSPEVTTSADSETPILYVTVRDPDPVVAQAVAAAYGEALLPALAELDQVDSPDQWELRLLAPVGVPTTPASPKPFINLGVGLGLGLVLGLGAALVRESLDRRLTDTAAVEEEVDAETLGVVPDEHGGEPLVAVTHPQSLRAEAYRKIRTNLLFATPDGMPRSLVVTSAIASEGKTSVAANLAATCARAGQRVVIVDADMRRPMIHRCFDVREYLGLSDILSGEVQTAEAIQHDSMSGVDVITGGPIPDNPSELVGSQAMTFLIGELESMYDVVIIDTPPVLPVPDALQLAVQTGGAVVVTRLRSTRRELLADAVRSLRRVKADVLGVVPNGATATTEGYYGQGYTSRPAARTSPAEDVIPISSVGRGSSGTPALESGAVKSTSGTSPLRGGRRRKSS